MTFRKPALPATPLLLLSAVCIWGVIPFVIQFVARDLRPAEVVGLRMTAAGALLALLRPRGFFAALWRHRGPFLALALLGVAGPGLLYVYALRDTGSIPVISFVGNSYPVWAVAMAAIFLRERPSLYHLAGLACAVAGLCLMAGIVPGRDLSMLRVPPDVLLVLAASLGWASSSVISKAMTASVDATTLSAGRHLVAGAMMWPVMLAEGVRVPPAGAATWLALAVLIAMSIASWQLYYWGLARTSVSSASLVEIFAPVVTWGFSVLFLGQGLDGVQVVAACLILAGTLLVSANDLRRPRAVVPAAPKA